MITRVTITGPDDSISPSALIALNDKYQFVEWGILVSQKHFGANRFPSMEWIKRLELVKKDHPEIKLSCHLCGKYVRDLCLGSDLAIKELGELWNMFDRVQINFHGIPHNKSIDFIHLLLEQKDKEFIFQFDDVNNSIIESVSKAGVNCSALFDTSGGAGILPNEWPEPLQNIKCGYAGGISPENIEAQIKLIESKVGETEIWIDMETHVRSNNDSQFDLSKVEKCLEISSSYVSQTVL